MSARFIVGIDLGTTHTVVAWTRLPAGGPIEVLAIPQLVSTDEVEARPLLASLLYAPIAGERVADPWHDAPWVLGEHARRRGQEVPGRLVSSAKSWLCHAAVDRQAAILPWGADEEATELPRLSPVEASARLLLHARSAWNSAFAGDPLEAQQIVLTVPASFDQAARELTVRAAHQAGLDVRLLEEPQAAFYDFMQRAGGEAGMASLVGDSEAALVLVCDVGGGTTDLSLIRASISASRVTIERVAVGRHLLVGGDNMDLALAHVCEPRMIERPARLDARRFAQLVLACRDAKERLLAEAPVDDVAVTVLGRGSQLVGGTSSTRLGRVEAESVVLDGFFPACAKDERSQRRGRVGLVAFGLPYEQDPAITRHVAEFLARHAPDGAAPSALLLNGGCFRSPRIVERLSSVIGSWSDTTPALLALASPDLAVARGAVAYGMALGGHGLRIGGGAPQGYYVGVDRAADGRDRAICVVPRGAREGERHLAGARTLALVVGRPVRFDLYASASASVHSPGQIVEIDDDTFERLPPVATTLDANEAAEDDEVRVGIEGELSAIGTLELSCVETATGGRDPRRFRLAFDLRNAIAGPPSRRPPAGEARHRGLAEAVDAIDRVFGKGRGDVKAREVKDLYRELERLLGERTTWSSDLLRALFDAIAPRHASRRRSPDHERVFWMLAGYCLRPGFGDPLDERRVRILGPLWEQGVQFPTESRNWQQYFIAWRRIAGGLDEALSGRIRDRLDAFIAPLAEGLKKPKGFKPLAADEMLELAASLERVPAERRALLGRWLIERTWTDRNPRLWAAIGRIGARVPTYASIHHVVPLIIAERWLDHLLREKWEEMPTAPRAALQLGRLTGDRARDVGETLRNQIATRLERAGVPREQALVLREVVAMEDAERAEFFGDTLPSGLRLVEDPAGLAPMANRE